MYYHGKKKDGQFKPTPATANLNPNINSLPISYGRERTDWPASNYYIDNYGNKHVYVCNMCGSYYLLTYYCANHVACNALLLLIANMYYYVAFFLLYVLLYVIPTLLPITLLVTSVAG